MPYSSPRASFSLVAPFRNRRNAPSNLLSKGPSIQQTTQFRFFTSPSHRRGADDSRPAPKLSHVTASGSARMVSVSEKTVTSRMATAVCTVKFSSPTALDLIRDNQMQKGDVLGVARVAGIMAAKRTPDLIPLCHPIVIDHVIVDLDAVEGKEGGSIEIKATVKSNGKTGVEMEALTAASTAALTIYDMCKAVDKAMVVEGLRVILKDGGKSGRWELP